MKASDLFVKALEAEGVECIFGISGEENLDLLESLRNSSIKLVLTRHEQGAGFMAATYGRLTGNTALSDGDFVHRAIERADLIINVGHDIVEKPPFFMHHNDKKVIHVNFETAVRRKLDLVVIILRDDAYGMIKWKQANMQFDEFGLDYGNPNFVKYAQSYGAKGWRVDDTDVLTPMVETCLNTPGVHIIDCPVDYSMNDKTLNQTIKELSAKL